MELLNATAMAAGFSVAMDVSGRDLLVVVVKGTFRMPKGTGGVLRLSSDQVPLVLSDVFTGEPGASAPLYEVDFAAQKPRCDVLLNGSAYSPAGKVAPEVQVALSVGRWSKSFRVVGHRFWEASGIGIRASSPASFQSMPIGYGAAFGGTDRRSDNPSEHGAFLANPVGLGFHKTIKHSWIDGSPLPNTEQLSNPIRDVTGEYSPMAFGVVGRNWEPRLRFAGTYDQAWLDETFPFLPSDFDDRYYQASPPDQQIPKPVGGEQVSLLNLTPDGQRSFLLPSSQAPVHVFLRGGKRQDFTASMDTILIEPDNDRVLLTWRVTRPITKDVFEIQQVLVGNKSAGWWRARETGKAYYSSLADIPRRGADERYN